jgi:WD40 repeat protein/serine/threonine protein kinase
MSELPSTSNLPALPSLPWHLDQICDRFEAAWQAAGTNGPQPPIAEYLQGVAESEQILLLPELIALDAAYRRLRGETPQEEDYHAFAAALDQAALSQALAGRPGTQRESHKTVSATLWERFTRPPTGRDAAVPSSGASWPALPGFEILDELGRGGMGIVYRAWQVQLRRLVALKMVRAGVYASRQAGARLRVEAEAVGRLQHPNIVQIHEVGEYQGCPYFALEYVDGGSLAHKLGGKPLPAHAAAQLVETLAQAMHYAHQRGIVHRDLKPGNILLAEVRDENAGTPPAPWTRTAVPKITDFSLAKILVGGGEAQTQTGDTLGTPSYMAPEQAAGRARDISPCADVYALGAILYELLTGRLPFQGETPLDTLQQVLTLEPVSPRRLQPKMPRDLETICLKCLQKEPRKRYPSAALLAEDLRRFRAGEPIRARPVGQAERLWRWCRRNPAIASLTAAIATLLVVVALGATFAAFGQRRLAQDAERARDDAVAARRQAEELLERQYVAQAVRLMEEDDPYGALPWIIEGLRLVEGDATRAAMHRFRLGAALQHRPRFVRVWFHAGVVQHAAFSPDGRLVVTACADGTARLWEVDTGRLRATLQHEKKVGYAAFSPDGARVVTASADHTARLWDAATGQRLATWKHETSVGHAAFHPDGRRVVTACADGKARVWEATTRQPLTIVKHEKDVIHAEFSPDGACIVTASRDGTARVWNAATGIPLTAPLQHNRYPVAKAAFSPDGKRVVTASYPAARVWNAATGRLIAVLDHITSVTHAAFSPDSRWVVTTSLDNTAQVWNAATGQRVAPALKHNGHVNHASFSPDGRRVVTAGMEGTVQVWDAATGARSAAPLHHCGAIWRATFSPDGRHLLTASSDETARLWDLGGPAPTTVQHKGQLPLSATWLVAFLATPTGPNPFLALSALVPKRPHLIFHAVFSPDGRFLATAGWDWTAQIWDVATGQPLLNQPLQHRGPVRRVNFSSDGRRLVTASLDRTARVWDVATGRLVAKLGPHGDEVFEALFSPNGQQVVTASLDGKARVWDAATGGLLLTLKHPQSVGYAEFSPDGARVVTACNDGTAQVWDAATGLSLITVKMPSGGVGHAAFSPDGRYVVTASSAGTAQVWEVSSGQSIGEPLKHKGGVSRARFSPDGRRVLTASSDGTARVWDAATGQPRTPPLRHEGRLLHADFSPDGCRVITASTDGAARVWDAATGEPITPVLRQRENLWHAAFSPDGRRAVTTATTAQIWELPFEDRPVADLVRIAQVLTGLEMRAPGQFVPLEIPRFRDDWNSLWSKYPEEFLACPPEHRRGVD